MESKEITALYLAWLDNELRSGEINHNHKEKLAWTATAAYIPAILVLGRFAPRFGSDRPLSWAAPVIETISVLLFAIATYLFVSMQFQRRWLAAEKFNALQEARRHLVFSQVPKDFELLHPKFIEFARMPIPEWEAQLLAPKRKWYFLSNVEARKRTEAASYSAIGIATLLAIAQIWFRES